MADALMDAAAAGRLSKVNQIHWTDWEPKDTATLTFVMRGGEVLLIRKKRGLGAGKVNGPGGRLEPGESIVECAIREVEEELGITPLRPTPRGELKFQFRDGYSIHAHVFTANDFEGEARETDEAIPLWTSLDAIPYAEMWEDDILWLPRVLAGETISGRFLFDDDAMLDHRLETVG